MRAWHVSALGCGALAVYARSVGPTQAAWSSMKGAFVATPRAHTAQAWLTFGFDADLNVAARNALGAMIGLIAEQYRLAQADALALASLVVDLRITQMVNQVCGVHAVLPHGAIQQ